MKNQREIYRILREYDIEPKEALWDCHGTTVIYHRHIEIIGAKAGISFDAPLIVEGSLKDKIAVMIVTGHMGERTEWSTGEASPANNKNPYPYAMAEKRAKDRVILKLVGLHGHVYSEEEADDFKATRPGNGGGEPSGNATLYASERMEKLVWAMIRKAKTQFGDTSEARNGKTWADLEAWVRSATRNKGDRLTMDQFDNLKELFVSVGLMDDRK